MNILTRRQSQIGKLPLLCAFSSILVFCSGASAADEKIMKLDGITYKAAESVSNEAFRRAQFVVQQMTSVSPNIRERMAAEGFTAEIIGRDQVLSDVPDYAGFKGKRTGDGRDYDTETRGLGGHDRCCVGEENLLCLRRQPYWAADVFVHEFAHSMMSYMDAADVRQIESAYANAVSKGLYPVGIYMMANSQEYWAEGVQSWLGVTARTDVNGGFNTQEKIRDHDKALAAVLTKVYGSLQLEHVPGCIY